MHAPLLETEGERLWWWGWERGVKKGGDRENRMQVNDCRCQRVERRARNIKKKKDRENREINKQ